MPRNTSTSTAVHDGFQRVFQWIFQWRIAALLNGLQDVAVYRLEYFIEIVAAAIVPATVQLIIWHAVFTLGPTTELAGMTHHQVIAYTLTSVLFSQIRGGDHDFQLAEMIRSGDLSHYLLRPVNPVEFVYFRGIASRLTAAALCLGVGLIATCFTDLSALRLIAALGLALLGNIIHYLIGASIASAAFYWEEAYSVLMVKNLVVSLLSGELIPLFLFPQGTQWIWQSTPFYLYVFGPTQYALGNWTHQQFIQSVGMALLWIAISSVLVKFTWQLGMKRYLSLGG